MRHTKALFILSWLIWCCWLHAEPLTREAKLNKLMDLLQIEEAQRAGVRSCIAAGTNGELSPLGYVKNRGAYYGFTPRSAAWPKVVAAHRRYLDQACAATSPEQMRAIYIKFYSTHADEKSLDAWITFLSSAEGQSFMKLQEGFMKQVTSEVSEISGPKLSKIQQRLDEEIRAIQSAEKNRR